VFLECIVIIIFSISKRGKIKLSKYMRKADFKTNIKLQHTAVQAECMEKK